jgi:hypothetical protein
LANTIEVFGTKENEMKTDKSFRLSKETKMMMGNFINTQERNEFKKLMMSAEQTYNENKKKKLRVEKSSDEE